MKDSTAEKLSQRILLLNFQSKLFCLPKAQAPWGSSHQSPVGTPGTQRFYSKSLGQGVNSPFGEKRLRKDYTLWVFFFHKTTTTATKYFCLHCFDRLPHLWSFLVRGGDTISRWTVTPCSAGALRRAAAAASQNLMVRDIRCIRSFLLCVNEYISTIYSLLMLIEGSKLKLLCKECLVQREFVRTDPRSLFLSRAKLQAKTKDFW